MAAYLKHKHQYLVIVYLIDDSVVSTYASGVDYISAAYEGFGSSYAASRALSNILYDFEELCI